MSYLVMETHPAYAVVMDEEGRFLKAANLRYQVGDTVQEIIELQMPRKKAIPLWKPLSGLAGLAACFCLVFFGYYRPNFTAYGTLRIQINPDVEMTVSRTDRVLDLEGLNEDGEDLIAGYSYRGKDRETTAEELVERAIDMGYLSDGDTISITVNSSDPEWRAREEVQVQAQLEERYGESIVIQLGGSPQQPSPAPASGTEEVVIPVTPPTPAPTGEEAAPVSDPDRTTVNSDTDYGPSGDGVTNYEDTDYGPNADGVTNYEDTDYGPNADGVTNYEDTDYGPNADGVTNYEDTDYGPYNDGVTDYADRGDDSDDDWGNDDDDDGNWDDDDDSDDDDDGDD